MIGRTLSHYRIVEPLGAGGMGEVYRARDEKLGRDVAVKVLPADALSDDAARRRFHKEAEALVRLSHPHIATVFDVDSADGTDFIVMEVVPGPTLKERLHEGPLREKEVVRLGAQLVRGLMAAHEKGIVHRDLKPSNLSLTEDGLLKILDFGLVRLLQPESAAGETAPTETAAGRAAGTLPYMSPEQLRGRGVDARSDLYAVGAVLFELATGRRVFEQTNEVELADAILHEAPPLPRSLKPTLSLGLEGIILKALDKDPELRYQTAREMLVDLERLQVGSTDAHRGTLPTPSRSRTLRGKGALATIAVFALGVGLWLFRPLPPPRITNFRAVTGGLEAGRSDHVGPHWATDGVRLYYMAGPGDKERLFQVPVTGGDAVEVELSLPLSAELYGYVAPESALLMGASSGGDPTLQLFPVPAGAPRRMSIGGTSAAPSLDGETLAVVQPGRIVLVRRDGSTLGEITSLPTEPIRATLSPDGRRVRYEAPGPTPGERWIWDAPVEGGRARPLWPGERGQWTPDGRYFLFDRFSDSENRHDLFAVREGRLPWSSPGTPVRLTSGPLGFYAVGTGPDGPGLFAWGTTRRGELLRYDTQAEEFEKYLGGASAYYVDGSPDGQWLAWVSFPDQTLWRSRVDGSEKLRLTGPGWQIHLPRWSPDGRQIVFAGCEGGKDSLGLYRVPAQGGEPEALVPWDPRLGNLWDPCWLPDGDAVVYSHLGRSSSLYAGLSTEGSHPSGIYRVDSRSGEVTQLPDSESFWYPKCSAQGHILAMTGPFAEGGWPYSLYSLDKAAWEEIGGWNWAYPTWSRDGETITAYNQDDRRIERWSRRTRRMEVVADVSDIPLGSWANARWIGLAPDGSPLIMRDRSTRDIYALEWEAP